MGRSKESLELKKKRYLQILNLEDGTNKVTEEIIYERLGIHGTTQRKWKREWYRDSMAEWEE